MFGGFLEKLEIKVQAFRVCSKVLELVMVQMGMGCHTGKVLDWNRW